MQEMQEMQVRSLGSEDPLEEEMATHSSILAWRIPWTEETGGLWSIGLQRVGHNWSDLVSMHIRVGGVGRVWLGSPISSSQELSLKKLSDVVKNSTCEVSKFMDEKISSKFQSPWSALLSRRPLIQGQGPPACFLVGKSFHSTFMLCGHWSS